MISNDRYTGTLLLQFLGLGVLGLNIFNLVSPTQTIAFFDMFSAASIFAGMVGTVFLFKIFFNVLSGKIARCLNLVLAMVAVYQVASGAGILHWYMLSYLLLLNLIFYLELMLADKRPYVGLMTIIVNMIALLYLFVDCRIYLITKTHISYKQLVELAQVFDLVVDSSKHTGQQMLAVLFESGLYCALPLVGAMRPEKNNFSFALKKVYASIAVALFLVNYHLFAFVCRDIPLVQFLPIRLELGNLPIPLHPSLARDERMNQLVNQKITINDSKIFPALSFSFRQKKKELNLVLIAIESLRRQEFEQFMPLSKGFAMIGCKLADHYSTSNISASSFHSIFRSSFPINLNFRNTEVSNNIAFQDFLLENGYETITLKAAKYSAFPERMTWGKRSIELDIPDKAKNPSVILAQAARILAEPGKKAMLVYLFNTHFNYYYTPEFEIHKPVLDENANLFLITPDSETVLKVANRYRNAVGCTDSALGDFLQKMKESGRLEDTLFVIFGDHGESLGESGFFAHATGPHRYQFEVPFFMVGGGLEGKRIGFPTTHSDLLPIVCEQMGIDVQGCWGKGLSASGSYPILQIDESVTGRILVRHEKFMSIFDLDWEGNLKWLATVSNDFAIDESVAGLYLGKDLGPLAQQVRSDIDFIKSSIY